VTTSLYLGDNKGIILRRFN